MNYVDDRTIAICIACGDELPIETQDPSGAACDSCFTESEAKAAEAKLAQDADELRWLSANWFKTSHLERLPFNSRAARFY